MEVFKRSGLDVPLLNHIYSMADDDRDTRLSAGEFAVAFHLIVCIGLVLFVVLCCLWLFFFLLLRGRISGLCIFILCCMVVSLLRVFILTHSVQQKGHGTTASPPSCAEDVPDLSVSTAATTETTAAAASRCICG
jgi:hypothetical protein